MPRSPDIDEIMSDPSDATAGAHAQEAVNRTLRRVNEALNRRLEKTAMADAMTESLHGISDLQEILPRIMHGIAQILDFRQCGWFAVDQEHMTLRFSMGSDAIARKLEGCKLQLEEGQPLYRAVREKRSQIACPPGQARKTAAAASQVIPESSLCTLLGGQAFVAVPFQRKVEKRCWLVLDCPFMECPAWGSEDLPCWKTPHTFRCPNMYDWRQTDRTVRFDKAHDCLHCHLYNLKESCLILLLAQREDDMSIRDEDLELLGVLSSRLSLVIENALLHEDLTEKNRTLQKRQHRMDKELALAREIQKAFLPTESPRIEGIELAALNIPAKEVGGDLYYYSPVDDRHFGFGIADVSGKGVPAALMMSMASNILQEATRRYRDAVRVMDEANRHIYQYHKSGQYVTAFHAVYNMESSILHYAKAGHEAPLLIHRDRSIEELDTDGFFLGIFENGSYQEKEAPFLEGDRLYLFTDGIMDVCNPHGEKYGRERLLDLLLRCHDQSFDEVIDIIKNTLHAYMDDTPQKDDITMLVLARIRDRTLREAWSIRAVTRDVSAALGRIESVAGRKGLSRECIHRIIICCREALNNAVEHGCKNAADAEIHIDMMASTSRVSVTVTDPGPGYDPRRLKSPLDASRLLDPRGRGVFLIKEFADDVRLNETGNSIAITVRESGR